MTLWDNASKQRRKVDLEEIYLMIQDSLIQLGLKVLTSSLCVMKNPRDPQGLFRFPRYKHRRRVKVVRLFDYLRQNANTAT